MLSEKAAAVCIPDALTWSALALEGKAFPSRSSCFWLGLPGTLVSEPCQEAGEEAKGSLVVITIQIVAQDPPDVCVSWFAWTKERGEKDERECYHK